MQELFWKQFKKGYRWNYAFVHINKCGGTSIEHRLNLPKIHYSAQNGIDIVGRERWDSVFTFSVVRHPYSRIVSLYEFRKKESRLGQLTKNVNEWIYECLVNRREGCFMVPNENHRHWQCKEIHMQSPMIDWLRVDGQIAVNTVYKLENIDEEWPKICNIIGCKENTLLKLNNSIGTSYDYAVSILNDETIEILNEYYKEDFEIFDYDIKKV